MLGRRAGLPSLIRVVLPGTCFVGPSVIISLGHERCSLYGLSAPSWGVVPWVLWAGQWVRFTLRLTGSVSHNMRENPSSWCSSLMASQLGVGHMGCGSWSDHTLGLLYIRGCRNSTQLVFRSFSARAALYIVVGPVCTGRWAQDLHLGLCLCRSVL